MKKVFTFNVPNKAPERQVESIKNEIRKYIKREKRKPLPEEVDFWKFVCRFGEDEKSATAIEFVDITKSIDEAFANKWSEFYIEILAEKGYKPKKEEE